MAKRTKAEIEREEARAIPGEVVAVAAWELAQDSLTIGSLPVKECVPTRASDGLADVAAEDGLYSHLFWALLMRAGYTPV